MISNFKSSRGKPIYGATVDKFGVNFGIFSKNAKSVTLELFKNYYDNKPIASFVLSPLKNKTGDVWHIYLEGVKAHTYYGYRVEGAYEPENGHRFNENKLLIDPYAKAISGFFNFEKNEIYSYEKNSDDDLSFSKANSADSVKGIIIDDSDYDWEDDIHPRISLQDSIIYEMHISLFTMNSNSNIENKGTYKGVLEKISHLKELGVTALELLPIFEFNKNELINTNPVTGELLRNVWGYNPLGFFAPSGNYISGNQSLGMSLGNQVFEFKDFIKALHKEGIEVILDVVIPCILDINERQ